MKNENIERRIEDTLNSLEGLQKAESNPFFYTKIEQRLRNTQQGLVSSTTFYRLAFALIILIVLNVFTYTKFHSIDATNGATKTGIEAFASEYGLQQSGVNI
jgi:hypothetical protein